MSSLHHHPYIAERIQAYRTYHNIPVSVYDSNLADYIRNFFLDEVETKESLGKWKKPQLIRLDRTIYNIALKKRLLPKYQQPDLDAPQVTYDEVLLNAFLNRIFKDVFLVDDSPTSSEEKEKEDSNLLKYANMSESQVQCVIENILKKTDPGIQAEHIPVPLVQAAPALEPVAAAVEIDEHGDQVERLMKRMSQPDDLHAVDHVMTNAMAHSLAAPKDDTSGRITKPGETIFVGGLRVVGTINHGTNMAMLADPSIPPDRGILSSALSFATLGFSAGLFVMYLAEWLYNWVRFKKKPSLDKDTLKEFFLGCGYFALGIVGMCVAAANMPLSFIFSVMGLFDSTYDMVRYFQRRQVAKKNLETNAKQIKLLKEDLDILRARKKDLALRIQNADPSALPALQEEADRLDEKFAELRITFGVAFMQRQEYTRDNYRATSTFAGFRQILRVVLALCGIIGAILVVIPPTAPVGLILLATAAFIGTALFLAHTIHRYWMDDQVKKFNEFHAHIDNPVHTLGPKAELTSSAKVITKTKKFPRRVVPPESEPIAVPKARNDSFSEIDENSNSLNNSLEGIFGTSPTTPSHLSVFTHDGKSSRAVKKPRRKEEMPLMPRDVPLEDAHPSLAIASY